MKRQMVVQRAIGFVVIMLLAWLLMRGGRPRQQNAEGSAGMTETEYAGTEMEMPGTNPPAAITPPLDLSTVSDNLRGVLGYEEKKTYVSRLRAVNQLGRDLSPEDVQTLFAFLNQSELQDNLSSAELNTVKNDILNVMWRQTTRPPGISGLLIAMYRDTRHDPMWRDYCIQHLGGWYGKAESDVEKKAIAEALWDATQTKRGTIAGTSLLSLSLNVGGPEISREAVSEKALQLCREPAYAEAVKMTAIQVCATLNDKEALPIAREWASGSSYVPLRMAALAAIGVLGEAGDRELLEKYVKSSDVRLRKSALAALEKLKARDS